jgi:hypothetical protein
MYRFLYKISPFFVLFLLILVVRFWVKYDPRYNFFIYDQKRVFKNQYIIIGDSKTLTGINDEVFKNNGISIINLSSWGATPFDLLKGLEKYQFENCTIILNASSRIFLHPDTTSSQNSPNNILKLFNFRLRFDDFGDNKKGRWEYKIQKSGSISFINLTRPYDSYVWKKDSTHYASLLIDVKKTENIKIDQFSTLISKLRYNNRVILIDLPERKEYNKLAEKYEGFIFSEISHKTGINIIDFGIYADSLFYDSHHLNINGQKTFSSELLKTIIASKSNHTHQGSN